MKRLLLILALAMTLPLVALAQDANGVFRSVEQMPQFPGGEAALLKYIRSHVNYPESSDSQATVILQFVVETDGSIGQAKVIRSVDEALDKEAIRVIKTLPKFTPGRQNGQPVPVWYTVPVRFSRNAGAQRPSDVPSSFNQDSPNDSIIFRSVEQMPHFPGGEAALLKYIMSHVNYPEGSDLEGVVILQFVVKTDGSIGEVKVLRGLDPAFDQEAIRLVKSLPNFTPGRQNGQPVAVWYTLPVRFNRNSKLYL
ncbi:MAG: energy transducer TonB [Muribaculaceae bacterium]|nr:energy transducer TonB [Muribaculaceae bacterium]